MRRFPHFSLTEPRAVALNRSAGELLASDSTYISFDNGNSTTSGTSYIPPGTYTFDITASAAWTLSF